MIVATRPEPTVRPPSRFEGKEIWVVCSIFTVFFRVYYPFLCSLHVVADFFRTILEPHYHQRYFSFTYSANMFLSRNGAILLIAFIPSF